MAESHNRIIITVGDTVRDTLQNKGPVPLILYKIRETYYAFRIVNMNTASFRIKRVRKLIIIFFVF